MRVPRGLTIMLGAVTVAAACGSSGVTTSKPATTTTTAAVTARQRAKTCTADDMSVNNVPVPRWQRLTSPRTEWFARVRLGPVPTSVHAKVSLDEAWTGFGTGMT